ncbi:MAG: Arylsulfatase [Planctomycetota bacterium]|jgi:arylsulfatase A-like enzyme
MLRQSRWLFVWLLGAMLVAQDVRPNVLFVVVDDLGWADLGCQGGPPITPNVDRLAGEGLRLTSAYAAAPNCAPSRAGMLSGQAPARTGIYTVGSGARGRDEDRSMVPAPNRTDLPEATITIAEMLRDAGYYTVQVGKWHLGPDPRTQGFDVNVGGNRAGSPPGGHFSPYRNPDLADGPKGESLTSRLTEELLAALRARPAGKPFFATLNHYAVHTPIQATKSQRERFAALADGNKRADYLAMVADVDASVGRVLAFLDDAELRNDTLVMFCSDNGGFGPMTTAGPLRGSKGMLYEGGVRVPCIVRWPGSVPAGATTEVPVTGLDWLPTLATITGAKPPLQPLDGDDISSVLRGAPNDRLRERELCWHFPGYLEADASVAGPWRTTPAGSIRRGRWKLVEWFESGKVELFDLSADGGETRDLAADEPLLAAELRGRLAGWRAITGAAMPAPKLALPTRRDGTRGASAVVDELANLSLQEREARLLAEFERGNVPTRLRDTVPVELTATIEGEPHRATIFCTADYFGIGSDDDWCRMPMSPPAYQRILDRLDAVAPTRRMVDAIWRAAVRQAEPLPFSPKEHDITALPLFLAHHRGVQEQLVGCAPGSLVAGIKKDVVVSPLVAANPGRVVIYGWHRPDGRAIQPLSKVHTFPHVDYSHGLRLVVRRMVLDGAWTTVDAVLADPTHSAVLSDEGVCSARLVD